jgi:hypothetical protein
MSGHTEPVGEMTAELRLLVDVLLERVDPWLRSRAESLAATGAGCGWCPLCAALATLRGERPELTRRLAEHGSELLLALRTMLEQHGDRPCPAGTPAAGAGSAGAGPVVQRIPVRRCQGTG